ncbi:biotin transport system substrate-specific component [Streptomyces sp. 1114.5]|uniref:biotin transporter BioY n=1 Tax=unclassified Streptomyces TaxID=2593676 RepID=UPI000BDB5ABF|nr:MULTISPECIES: biotin transporter BioY [unclassified Streptomyces]RKT17936.1 biotin transport system substrate-specific component [Streptomyces sp. 1114.5]SOB84143.1 biotin transport system substrate-specific component [Streptomyces sp. 1331.2]
MATATTPIPRRAVLADLLPAASTRLGAQARDLALVAGGAALTGVAAQLSVNVPGSPVPVTGQTFAALLVGTALGARRGVASLALYLLAGMAGLPWFAAGTSGWAMPSLGYVLGFVVAAALTGALARRGADRTPVNTAVAMVLGSLAIYAVGVPYLAFSLHVSLARAAELGLYPYLVGDALKAALAAGALPLTWKLLGRR